MSYNNFNFTESGYIPGDLDFNFGADPTPEIDYYYVLKGTSNNFSSVWVSNNKMYVSSSNTLTVIDLLTNTLYDWYDQTQVGRSNESLDHDDVVDITVG